MSSRNIRLLCSLLILALLLTGCSFPRDSEKGLSNGEIDPIVVAAQNRFGLDLYLTLFAHSAKSDPGVFISPSSIALALAMTYNGASGETKEAMGEVLGVGSLTLDAVNSSYQALLRHVAENMPVDNGMQLHIANGLFQKEGVGFRRDFLQRNERYYGATLRSLDFGDPRSVGVINNWVSEQTNGRIPDLLDEISADQVLFLINAIYFKGDWKQPFDKHLTRPMPFSLPNGEQKVVAMMYQDGSYDHYQGPGFEAVRLPYGQKDSEKEQLAMYIFLPDRNSSLEAFHAELTYENWQQWMTGFVRKRGRIALPRFQLAYKAQLGKALTQLGMGIAFDPHRADFSGMRAVSASANLFIGDVIHQSFLLVNEEGTEAAAATSVGMRVTSAPVYHFEFIVDRPFLLAICEEQTGAILFAGSVLNPDEADD